MGEHGAMEEGKDHLPWAPPVSSSPLLSFLGMNDGGILLSGIQDASFPPWAVAHPPQTTPGEGTPSPATDQRGITTEIPAPPASTLCPACRVSDDRRPLNGAIYGI